MTVHGTLYVKPGCHLCEDALAELSRLAAWEQLELRLVDITGEPELMRRYGERVPVLALDGREYAAPLPRAVLESAVRDATRAAKAHKP
jgi:glutaredoxin